MTAIFLRKILPGCAEKSYGIQVARLAGLPENVIARAKEVLQQLEAGHQPTESVKEVPVPTGAPAKTRKKAISDADARADDVVCVIMSQQVYFQ